jgi:hypothetical protein
VLAAQIEQIEAAVAAIEKQLMAWHKSNAVSQRLATIPELDQCSRRPSGPAVHPDSSTGRTHDCKRPLRHAPNYLLPGGGHPHMRRPRCLPMALSGRASRDGGCLLSGDSGNRVNTASEAMG